jgi:hypothetical protein
MALTYRTVTADRMWTILEAYSAFTALVPPSRRVKSDEVGWLKRMALIAPSDATFVDLAFGDLFGGGPVPFQQFGMEGASPSGEWIEQRNAEFKLRLVYRDVKVTDEDRDTLEMTAIEALEAAGRNLGVDYIRTWGPWRGRYGSGLFGTITRPLTEIIIPVTYEFSGSQL